mgnify:CR=1 FL=1
MQDNKRVVRSRRLYVSTSIMPSFFDQRKKLQKNLAGGVFTRIFGAKRKKWIPTHSVGR